VLDSAAFQRSQFLRNGDAVLWGHVLGKCADHSLTSGTVAERRRRSSCRLGRRCSHVPTSIRRWREPGRPCAPTARASVSSSSAASRRRSSAARQGRPQRAAKAVSLDGCRGGGTSSLRDWLNGESLRMSCRGVARSVSLMR
jgi:hypothetical protein